MAFFLFLRTILVFLLRLATFAFVFQWLWMALRGVADNYSRRKINALIVMFFFIYIILVIKLITIEEIGNGVFFAIYSVAVSFYILSRFALAYIYRPHQEKFDKNYQPTLSFGVPSKNEGGGYTGNYFAYSAI